MKPNRKPRGIFSTNLKYKMEDYSLTQADIVAATGAGTSNVSGWVTHNRNASATNTRKVAKFLCVTEGWLTTEHSDVSANQLGSRILFKTKQLGLNIKVLSEVVGVSQYYIKQWILGNKKPTYQQLGDLAVILEASTTWLEHGGAFDQQGHDTSKIKDNDVNNKQVVAGFHELKDEGIKESNRATDSDPETTELSDDDTTDYSTLFDQANKDATRRQRNIGVFGDSDSDIQTDEAPENAAATDEPAEQEDDVVTESTQVKLKSKPKTKAKKRKNKRAGSAKQPQSILESLMAQTTAITLPSMATPLDYIDIEVYGAANNVVVNEETGEVKTKGKQKLKRTGATFLIHRDVFEDASAAPESTIGFYNNNLAMSPVITKGAKCLVDKSKTQIVDGDIYIFRYEKVLGLAYLHKLPDGGLIIRSADKHALEDLLSADEAKSLKVIGWVFSVTNTFSWYGE